MSGERRAVVACDLDRTVIYSAQALQLAMPDEQAPRLLCVEVHEGRPLSFVTETAAGLLARLAERAVLVPATTRTRAQYRRVRLPIPEPRFAICANGGHLLVDGRQDRDWHADVRRRIAESSAPLGEVVARLDKYASERWLRKRRVAEELFAYLVVERAELPGGWLRDHTAWAAELGWTVSLQGRKVYFVPGPLTKSAALAEVMRRTGAPLSLAAGDSLLDRELLLAADAGFRPGHGELADEEFTTDGLTVVAEHGVLAGEELLRQLLHRAAPPR